MNLFARIRAAVHALLDPPPPSTPQAAFGSDAAGYSPNRHFNFYPIHGEFPELSTWQRETIISRARSLYANFPQIRHVVRTMVLLQGTLEPRPQTADAEWNELARRAFFSRAMNPHKFDLAGRLNFFQAQEWIETRALVDGDSLTVCTRSRVDGEAAFRFYSAPQITDRTRKDLSEKNAGGVLLWKDGRTRAFQVYNPADDSTAEVPARAAILYGHSPDPGEPRHPSELIAAIISAQDIHEINAQHKAQIKIAAQYAIVETKPAEDKTPGLSGLRGESEARRAARKARAAGQTSIPAQKKEEPLVVDGVKAISLSPGRDLKTIHSANPSNETRAFVTELVHSLAYGLGLDPQICFSPGDLGSANARFIIAKSRDVARRRNHDRRNWCNRIWQHVIAGEIAAGRLRPCRDPERAYLPLWVNRAEWSIDLGRDASAEISLTEANLTNPDEWCLSHFGMTYEDIGRKRIDQIAALKKYADAAGVPYEIAFPSRAGSAPASWEQSSLNKQETSEES